MVWCVFTGWTKRRTTNYISSRFLILPFSFPGCSSLACYFVVVRVRMSHRIRITPTRRVLESPRAIIADGALHGGLCC
jgi:hypothetical protein